MRSQESCLYFVRHCQSDTAVKDEFSRPLTPKGLADRVLVTRYFVGIPLAAVWSSPYMRAVQTLSPLADERGLPMQTEPDLRERDNAGWTADFEGLQRRLWAHPEHGEGQEESLQALQTRQLAVMRRLLHQYPGQNLAIASHGTAMSALAHHFDPSFGFEGFWAIRNKMPWLIRFSFVGNRFLSMHLHDFFA